METIFTKIFIVFVEVGVSAHGHRGEKQIRLDSHRGHEAYFSSFPVVDTHSK